MNIKNMNRDEIKVMLLEMITESMNIDYVYKNLARYPVYANKILELDKTKGKSYSMILAAFFINAEPRLDTNQVVTDEVERRNSKVYGEIEEYFNKFLIMKKNNKTEITLSNGDRTNFDLNNPRHTHNKNFEYFKGYIDNLEKKYGMVGTDDKSKLKDNNSTIVVMGTTIDKRDIRYPDINDPEFEEKAKKVVIVIAQDEMKSYRYGNRYGIDDELWCVARDPQKSNNLFYRYRLINEETIYYVYFPEKSMNDPESVLCLGVSMDYTRSMTGEKMISYTDRKNEEAVVNLSYLRKFEEFSGINNMELSSIFYVEEFNNEEEKINNLDGEIEDEEFKKLSHNERKMYISTKAKIINKNKWDMMDEQTQDLFLLMCEDNFIARALDGEILISIINTSRGKRYIKDRMYSIGLEIRNMARVASKEKIGGYIDIIFDIVAEDVFKDYFAINSILREISDVDDDIKVKVSSRLYEIYRLMDQGGNLDTLNMILRNSDNALQNKIIHDIIINIKNTNKISEVDIRVVISMAKNRYKMALYLIKKIKAELGSKVLMDVVKSIFMEFNKEDQKLLADVVMDTLTEFIIETGELSMKVIDVLFDNAVNDNEKTVIMNRLLSLGLTSTEYILKYVNWITYNLNYENSSNINNFKILIPYIMNFDNYNLDKLFNNIYHSDNIYLMSELSNVIIKGGKHNSVYIRMVLNYSINAEYFEDNVLKIIEAKKDILNKDDSILRLIYERVTNHMLHRYNLKFIFKFMNLIINIKKENLNDDDLYFIVSNVRKSKVLHFLRMEILHYKKNSLDMNMIGHLTRDTGFGIDVGIIKEIIKMKDKNLEWDEILLLLKGEIKDEELNDIVDLIYAAKKDKMDLNYLRSIKFAYIPHYSKEGMWRLLKKVVKEKGGVIPTIEDLDKIIFNLQIEKYSKFNYDELVNLWKNCHKINK